jgi:uncharacterized protein YutE (UPF0331/DUF86 family)
MINKDLIKRKINKIEGYVEEIRPILELPAHEIPKDLYKQRTLERNFQLIIDTLLDINTHIISAENLTPPDDMTETFFILGRAGFLPMDFVEKISPVVGLRNIVVHEYEVVDIENMVKDIQEGISQFGEYAVHIDNILKAK